MRWVWLLLVCSFAAHGEPFNAAAAKSIDEKIRALLETNPVAGLSIAVSYKDAEWMKGYGYARLSDSKAATPKTSYRIASVTKTLTAVAIMQLVEEGKVDLDATIQTYLPNYPLKPWPITVRALLTHLSGTYHYRDPSKEGHFKTHFNTEQSLAVFQDWPLAQEPGTKFLYSSYGYNLLGAIIEAQSGLSYDAFLRERIFSKAQMKRSGVENRALLDADSATGYVLKKGILKPSEVMDISSRFAGGGVRSTVEDLMHYGQALLKDKLVSHSTWTQMQLCAQTQDGRLVDYGFGFGVFPQHGHAVVQHMGSQPETSSLFMLAPADEVVIAVFTNVENQAPLLSNVADIVMEVLVEGGTRRRPINADDVLDQIQLDGMKRVFSYGLASLEGWSMSSPPPSQQDPTDAVGRLLSREFLAKDPVAAKAAIEQAHHPVNGAIISQAGAEMARTLETVQGAGARHRYAALGPIPFFADYLKACSRKLCENSWPQTLLEDIEWLSLQWESATETLSSFALKPNDTAQSLRERLLPLVNHSVYPDLSPELTGHATRLMNRGRFEEARRVLELNAQQYPFSNDAQLSLLQGTLLAGDETQAAELLEKLGLAKEALRKTVTALENMRYARAAKAAQWLRRASNP